MRIARVAWVVWFLPLAAFGATINVAVGPGLSFSPSSVTIAPGDTVQWNFASAHTSTSDRNTGAEVWDSGIRSSGSFLHTFTTLGNWSYYCTLHSSPAFLGGTTMNGVVHVAAPAVTITSVSPASALPGTTITITGTGFQNGATVTIGGASGAPVTFVGATSLRATVPNIAPGAATIVVTNPDTTSATFNGFVVTSLAVPAMSARALLLLACALAASALLALRRSSG